MADDLVQKLRNAATDWDGSQMVDGEPPRDILNCKDVRAIADEIERLRAEVATIRESRTVAERELAELRERFDKAPLVIPGGGWIDAYGKRVRLLVDPTSPASSP